MIGSCVSLQTALWPSYCASGRLNGRRRDRLFEARASFHQSFNDLLRGHFFADELQQGLSDGHIDLVFGGGVEDFFNGADAFGNVADFDKHLMQLFTLCEALS